MQGQGFQAKGSFGIPEKALEDLEKSKQKQATEEPAKESQAEPPVAAPPTTKESQAEADLTEEFLRLKAKYEKELGAEITEEDIRDCIFKGRTTKEVTLVAGKIKLKGEFRTVLTSEIQEIDTKLASFLKNPLYTEEGVNNERAILYLTYGWMTANGRSLGNTPDERRTTINNMNMATVQQASTAWILFNHLINFAMSEDKFLKKS